MHVIKLYLSSPVVLPNLTNSAWKGDKSIKNRGYMVGPLYNVMAQEVQHVCLTKFGCPLMCSQV